MNISIDEGALSINADQVLFRQGTESSGGYLIKSGSILCVKEHQGRLYPVYKAVAPEIIGEEFIGLINQHMYSAIANEDSEVIKLSSEQTLEIMEKAPEWIKSLLTTLSGRLQEVQNLIVTNRIMESSLSEELNFDQTREIAIKKQLANKG